MKKRNIVLMAFGAALLSGSVALVASGKAEKNPYLQPDETWISLSGKVADTQRRTFTLDYGEGVVTVEMDDWDWYNENANVLEGDKVTVYGRVDDDLFETTSIEASSVYVENLGTYFYASAADEEYDDDYDYWVTYAPIVIGDLVVRGKVTSVDGREFTIDTDGSQMRVDTIQMSYNPLDAVGYQRIDVGDYVSVHGRMDYDYWEKRELMADSVITLADD